MTEAFPDHEPLTKAEELRAGLEHIMESNSDMLQPGDEALHGMSLGVAVTIPGQLIRYGGAEQQFPDTLLPFRVERMPDGTFRIWQDNEEARRLIGEDKILPGYGSTRQELYLIEGMPDPSLVTYWMRPGRKTNTETNSIHANSSVLDGWLEVPKGTPYNYRTQAILRHPVKDGVLTEPDRIASREEVEAAQREAALNAMSPLKRLAVRALGWAGLSK
jgi:hypothetical protein